MVSSKRADLRAVWLLQSRRWLSRLEFWLFLVGYDRETRSFSSRIYVLYLIIFFSLWGLAVLVLLAGFASQVLSALPFDAPFTAAHLVGGVALVAFFLLELYSASRRSPFEFSEADSHLLCLTPLDRRIVAQVCFLGAWLVRGLVLWPGFVVLAYALLEAQSPGGFVIADLPGYMLAGLRMLVVAVPLHLGAQSLAWSAGAWRLQGKRHPPALHWLAPILALALLAAWVLSGALGDAPLPFWLWPLTFPMAAGLGVASLPAALALCLTYAALGLFTLWSASPRLSLARAAQETRHRETLRAATLTGAVDLAGEIRQRERLGAGRRPSRLPVRPGLAALIWRNALQGQRAFTLGQIVTWLGIFGLTLGMFLAPDWGARGWSLIFWSLLAGQEAVRYLAGDLRRWWLLRQLPYPSRQVILADLMLPLVGIALTGIGALVVANLLAQPVHPILVCLYFPGALVLGLSAALDILINCRGEHLLSGGVPGLSLLTVVLTLLLLAIPGWLAWLAVDRWSFPLWLTLLAALALIAGAAYALYRLAASRLRNIRP